jgi:hypothetical protein
MQERRRAPRAEYLIPTNFLVRGRIYSDYAQNVSMNGAAIRFPESTSFRIGEPVTIAFPMVKSQRQIDGEVVWISAKHFGIAFRSIGAKCKELTTFETETEERTSSQLKEQSKVGRIRQKRLRWNPSGSGDVKGYRLYWSKGGSVDFRSDHVDLGQVTEVILPDGVPSFPLIAGEIRIGITAINSVGNESAIKEVTAQINFLIPEAPGAIVIEDAEEPPHKAA